MSKMFLCCAPDNEKFVFGGVPFRAKREMLARGVSVCVRANEREQESERNIFDTAFLSRKQSFEHCILHYLTRSEGKFLTLRSSQEIKPVNTIFGICA